MKYVVKISGLFLLLLTGNIYGQNNGSPYSIVGIGDIESGSFDRSAGMANTGVSLSSRSDIYHSNPASFSKLDNHFFTIEMTTRFKSVNYSGKPITTGVNDNSSDMQVKELAMAIKVKPFWGASIGLIPFSSSNYSFNADKSIIGGFSTTAHYEGSGGLNQAYFANGFKLSKNFSVGLQTSLLFGSFDLQETLGSVDATGAALNTDRNIYMSKVYFKAGAQYDAKLNSKWRIALGATGSNKTDLNASYTLNVTEGGQSIIVDKSIKETFFKLPLMYTIGASAYYKTKFKFAADYQAQNWSNIQYKSLNYTLVNSNRISAGMEYTSKKEYYKQSYEKYYLQAGLFYSNSYLNINNYQLKDYGLTLGAGINSKLIPVSYQINLELGSRGTTTNNLIRENYTQISFTLVYHDFWFTRKIYN